MTSEKTSDANGLPRNPKSLGQAIVAVLGTLVVVAGILVLPGLQTVKSRTRSPCQQNMRLIGMAIQNYHHEHNSLPPAFVKDREGTPLYSWRVLILPYLADLYEEHAVWLMGHRNDQGFWGSWDCREREQAARNKAEQIRGVVAAYDLSEPWNGPNNRQLGDTVLEAFCCNHGDRDSTTDYLAIVGAETAWPENGVKRLDDFSDGTSHTILIVEVFGSDIHWSEPRDLQFESMSLAVNGSSGQGIRGPFPSGANVCFSDGHCSRISTDVDPARVRAMLTIDGQENMSWLYD